MATEAQRDHLKALMKWTVAHEPQIHYAQRRPMRTINYYESDVARIFKDGSSITMDCSEGVTCLSKWAGLKDPNGRGYDGLGYTGTLLGYLPHYSDPEDADVGALVVYGPGAGDHVSMVYTPGKDPMLWSHGLEGGPQLIKFSQQRTYHRKPITFLSIGKL